MIDDSYLCYQHDRELEDAISRYNYHAHLRHHGIVVGEEYSGQLVWIWFA